jgi:hypothetical protein
MLVKYEVKYIFEYNVGYEVTCHIKYNARYEVGMRSSTTYSMALSTVSSIALLPRSRGGIFEILLCAGDGRPYAIIADTPRMGCIPAAGSTPRGRPARAGAQHGERARCVRMRARLTRSRARFARAKARLPSGGAARESESAAHRCKSVARKNESSARKSKSAA